MLRVSNDLCPCRPLSEDDDSSEDSSQATTNSSSEDESEGRDSEDPTQSEDSEETESGDEEDTAEHATIIDNSPTTAKFPKVVVFKKLWEHQEEAIRQPIRKRSQFIMWCGTGKTRTLVCRIMLDKTAKSVVIVFPSLLLIKQFTDDYIRRYSSFREAFSTLCFCTSTEAKLGLITAASKNIPYTTETRQARKFFRNSDACNLVLVTYQSFPKLADTITKHQLPIDRLFFDEAHHTTSTTLKESFFANRRLHAGIPEDRQRVAFDDRTIPRLIPDGAVGVHHDFEVAPLGGIDIDLDDIVFENAAVVMQRAVGLKGVHLVFVADDTHHQEALVFGEVNRRGRAVLQRPFARCIVV